MHHLERRVLNLEAKLPAFMPACETCKGQEWRVVVDPEPMPESPCPSCGRTIRVVHIATDEDGPA